MNVYNLSFLVTKLAAFQFVICRNQQGNIRSVKINLVALAIEVFPDIDVEMYDFKYQ